MTNVKRRIDLRGESACTFTSVVRSAFILGMTKEDNGKHYIKVVLFEEKSVANAFGKMNKIKGSIKLYEDGTFKISRRENG